MILSEEGRADLQKHPLIEGLSEEEFNLLLQVLDEKDFQRGDTIIRQGTFSDELYLLVEGAITFNKPDAYDPSRIVTYLLHAPASFGEASFLNPGSFPFDIQAYDHQTHLYFLHRRQLEENPLGSQLLNKLLLHLVRLDLEGLRPSPLVLNQEHQGLIEEQKKHASLKHLKQEMLFRWLPKDWNSRERKEIEQLIDLKQLAPEEICIRQNDPITSLYLLIEGQLNVIAWDTAQNHPVLIEVLNPGDRFGENSLLVPLRSPYTIIAHQPSTLLLLERQKLEQNAAQATVQKLLIHLAQYTPSQAAFIKENYGEFPSPIATEEGSTGTNPEKNHLKSLHQQGWVKDSGKEIAALQVENQQLMRKKSFWLLALAGLILSFLDPYKNLGNIPAFAVTLLQVFIPVLLIHFLLKEPLKNWGWNSRFLGQSLLQAIIGIALFGTALELFGQIADLPALRFFSPSMWRNMHFSMPSIGGYLVFVIAQEWVRRGIVTLSLQRGLESGKGWWASLLSSLLFIGLSPFNYPFFALGLFLKDFILAKLFLRAPHLLGVILLHFVLGIFFAYLGWYTL